MSKHSLLARCRWCEAVFDVSAVFLDTGARARQSERAEPALPTGFTVQRRPAAVTGGPYRSSGAVRDDLIVEWRWRHRKHTWFLRGTWLWLGFLVVWYVAAGAKADGYLLAFPTIHVLVGLAMLYVAAAIVYNRTRLTLRGDTLEVRSFPVPWRGDQQIPVCEIAQLYCKQEVVYRTRRGPIVAYRIYVQLRSGARVTLVHGLPEAEQALYLEQQIEDCLGIVDIAVPGEFKSGTDEYLG